MGGGRVKFGDFMVRIKKELPHVFLLAGEERYYIDRALEAILAQLFPDGGARDGLTSVNTYNLTVGESL